jgi:1-acyl-sn-glycerol-3-phosphate acyltransferase
MRYSAAASALFDAAFRPWRRTRLHTAPILGLPAGLPADRPLVIVANHTSWWDGFLLRDVHAALRPGAPVHTVMTATELRQHRFLSLLGAVPLQPGSPSSLLRLLRTLRRGVESTPAMTVVFFPQGRIWPSTRRPLGFQRGVEVLLRSLGSCIVLPAAIHMEPLNRAAPTAFVSLGEPRSCPGTGLSASELEAAVAERLDHVAGLLHRHGESLPGTLAALEQSSGALPSHAPSTAAAQPVLNRRAPA